MVVGRAFTVKALVFVATPPSGFVTVTVRAPVGVPASIVMLSVSADPLGFTFTGGLTVIPVPNVTEAPDCRPEPVRLTSSVAPLGADVGLSAVMVGFAFTVKQPVQVAVPAPPGFVTRTSRAPRAAFEDSVTGTVRWVESMNDVAPTVTPLPRIATTSPLTKDDP